MNKYSHAELMLMAEIVLDAEAVGDPRAHKFYAELARRSGLPLEQVIERTELMATFGGFDIHV